MNRNKTMEAMDQLNIARKRGCISSNDVIEISKKLKIGLTEPKVLHDLVAEISHRNAELGTICSDEMRRFLTIISN